MRFRAVPVTSLEDATLDFEQLQTVSILDSTPQDFVQLITPGTFAQAVGVATFNGSAVNAIGVTVVTGIGRTITGFQAISTTLTAGDWFVGSFANSGTLGTVTCTAFRPFGNFTVGTNNYSFNWVAFG